MMSSFLVVPLVAALGAPVVEPARLDRWSLGDRPPLAQGGGEVLIELAVSAAGAVTGARILRDTPPFTEMLRRASMAWTFTPATDGGQAVASRVLLAGLFRPPVLQNVPTIGEPPREAGEPSAEVAFPSRLVPPAYPPTAIGDALVLLEASVSPEGLVRETRVLRPAPGFDGAADEAARQWRFRSARRGGAAAASRAYLVFGFRQPVTPPQPAPP
ncbi:MAG TPA: hypothetical protein VLI67_09780 [Vicinamibacteria bacterium]|nr:hypothetical protein [Vicinamibacteria bacterium]